MPNTAPSQTKPTLKAWIKSFFYGVGNFFIRYPLATAATIFLVVVAVVFAVSGKQFQIGGLLGRLWGKKHPRDLPDAPVVTPPSDRIDDKGQIIPPGKSDNKGFVQAPVILPIKDPGIMSDPTTIVVTHPDGKNVVLPLPKGVKNKDVKEVVLVAPNVYQVANNDKPTVDAGKLLEELNK